METITIPKEKYEEMLKELERLKKESTEDLALLSDESFAETWLNEKEDEAWKDL